MGGAYEVSSETVKKYYSVAGMTVATLAPGASAGVDDGSVLQYLLTDHLGSVVAVTDDSGTLISQQRYLPFGEVRTDLNGPRIAETDFGYTGQRNVADLGLMDYRARFYDPTIGRFIQPDTIIPSYANPQTLNRFSYVLNSPVVNLDSTGHFAIPAIVVVVGIPVVAFLVIYAVSPQFREAANAAGEDLANAMVRWQQNNSHQWQDDYMDSQRGQTADNGPILPSSGNSVCRNNPIACLTVGISILAGIAASVYCSADGESCTSRSNQDQTGDLPTSAPTSVTGTAEAESCPPYRACPTANRRDPSSGPARLPGSQPKPGIMRPPPTHTPAIPL
jgi:RHS repeat-associated protein